MEVLRAVRALGLADWAIGAGFVRAAVWDRVFGVAAPTPLADIDVLYFDARRLSPHHDRRLERMLAAARPDVPWSVKNQARMHRHNRERPYGATAPAIAHWIETPTCVAVRLAADDTLTLIAPLGLDDLVRGRVRPTPAARRKMPIYRRRLATKRWRQAWPGLTIRMV